MILTGGALGIVINLFWSLIYAGFLQTITAWGFQIHEWFRFELQKRTPLLSALSQFVRSHRPPAVLPNRYFFDIRIENKHFTASLHIIATLFFLAAGGLKEKSVLSHCP